MGVSPAEDSSTEPDYSGSSTYVRFDVPKLKIKKSWPGIKGKIITSDTSTMIVYFFLVVYSSYEMDKCRNAPLKKHKLSSSVEHDKLHNPCSN